MERQKIVDISREFLNSNGAEKHTLVTVTNPQPIVKSVEGKTNGEKFLNLADDLNICSKRGLSERFDSTIGANTVLMPFGGKYQMTPAQGMAAKFPFLIRTQRPARLWLGATTHLSPRKSVSRRIPCGCGVRIKAYSHGRKHGKLLSHIPGIF